MVEPEPRAEDAPPSAPDCTPKSVSFPDLVRAHFAWRRLEDAGDGAAEDARQAYCRELARFEVVHGPVVSAYWCSAVESATALTAQPLLLGRRRLCFHRVSDWATKGQPDIAGLLHRCDELAVRGRTVLTGLRQRICLELVLASASHLLSLVDARASHDDPEKTAHAVEQERQKLGDAERYYREAANGQAQMVYVGGMAAMAAAIAAASLVVGIFLALPDIDEREFYATFVAGALGAFVSVIQRITTGSFRLEFDVGRPYLFFLGGLRPLLGGVFGLLAYFAVASAIVELSPIPDSGTARFYALLALAFASGFSERWAQDTLIAAAAPGKVKPAESQRTDVEVVEEVPPVATYPTPAP